MNTFWGRNLRFPIHTSTRTSPFFSPPFRLIFHFIYEAPLRFRATFSVVRRKSRHVSDSALLWIYRYTKACFGGRPQIFKHCPRGTAGCQLSVSTFLRKGNKAMKKVNSRVWRRRRYRYNICLECHNRS